MLNDESDNETTNIMKKVAIIVQPHQQISNSKNRKYGGVERIVTSLIEGLLERNVDVTLYTAKECRLDCDVRYPIGIIDGVFGDKTDRIELLLYSQKVREDLETEDFDVVHNHYDPITFVTLQGLGIPTITTLHGPATAENINIFGRFSESNFSAISQAQKDSYPANMNFVGHGFIHNSIADDHPFSDDKKSYLFSVSRIQPIKGQKHAIEIAQRSNLDLIIAGNCLDEKYFNDEIRPYISRDLNKPGEEGKRREFIIDISKYQNSGRSITYVGEVTEQERDQLMKHAKALLFPIEVEESFGLVLIEAGIVGTPVIAFDRGAVPEIVEHGKTGFYGNTIDELVGFTKRASEIDPTNCREHIKLNFSSDRMVENYLTLYRDVADKMETKQNG